MKVHLTWIAPFPALLFGLPRASARQITAYPVAAGKLDRDLATVFGLSVGDQE